MDFEFARADFRAFGFDLFQTIYATGPLVAGDAARLEALLDAWEVIPGGGVVIDSTGGSVGEGLKLGRLIRARGLNTYVGRRGEVEGEFELPGECLSAA